MCLRLAVWCFRGGRTITATATTDKSRAFDLTRLFLFCASFQGQVGETDRRRRLRRRGGKGGDPRRRRRRPCRNKETTAAAAAGQELLEVGRTRIEFLDRLSSK